MDWFYSIVRIAGASFPVASSLVQLQAEVDSKKLLERVRRLEDPISFVHEDIPELSRLIYRHLKSTDSPKVVFSTELHTKFKRPLAALEKLGCIKGTHAIGEMYVGGFWLSDPTFVMYMCALEEDKCKMENLINLVDRCQEGQWLKGPELQKQIDVPMPVIAAVFEIFERKGFGLCSNEVGATMYMGQA
jgi:hypothetical protein